MPIHFFPEKDNFKSLIYDLELRLDELKLLGANIVAYNCTVGSMACPKELLIRKMEEKTGVPAVSTAGAFIAALQALGADKIAIASPYSPKTNAHEKKYIERFGIEVVKMKGMTFNAVEPELGKKFSEVPKDIIFQHAISVDHPKAKAIFLSCANFPTASLIQSLENTLKKPVITSNTATFWAGLRKGNINDTIKGFGSLLSEH